MGMSAGNHQSQQGKAQVAVSLLALFEQDGMNVTFEMINRNQRLFQRERQRFGVADADQERSGKARALGDGDCVD